MRTSRARPRSSQTGLRLRPAPSRTRAPFPSPRTSSPTGPAAGSASDQTSAPAATSALTTRTNLGAALRATSRASASATSSAAASRASDAITPVKCVLITRMTTATPRTAAQTAVACVCGLMARCEMLRSVTLWFSSKMSCAKDSHSLSIAIPPVFLPVHSVPKPENRSPPSLISPHFASSTYLSQLRRPHLRAVHPHSLVILLLDPQIGHLSRHDTPRRGTRDNAIPTEITHARLPQKILIEL